MRNKLFNIRTVQIFRYGKIEFYKIPSHVDAIGEIVMGGSEDFICIQRYGFPGISVFDLFELDQGGLFMWIYNILDGYTLILFQECISNIFVLP